MNEIDKLRPEVRDVVNGMDHVHFGRFPAAEAFLLGYCQTKESQYWHTIRAELVRLSDVEAELAALKAFAQDIMRAWPEGDVDGGELQDAALRHGLLRKKSPRPTEPCGDACTCAEYYSDDDWHDGVTCYERTALLADA